MASSDQASGVIVPAVIFNRAGGSHFLEVEHMLWDDAVASDAMILDYAPAAVFLAVFFSRRLS